ncbi:MAG: TPM domain-containing protein [Nitrospiraceae bacterium]|nr:MAG: TPM domain-containing protein [Nitrospiraceae bacterium]
MILKSKLLITLLLSTLCLYAADARAEVSVPARPATYVVDLANIINDNVEANLNAYLQELEQKTTAQMVVLTIASLGGESLEDFSITIAHDKWKLGQKGKDNGVLLLVALQERKYRFEIGYGLEGILPDSLVGTIGRQYLVPYFRKGDYSNGIFAASLAAISEIASDAGVEITGMPKLRSRSAYSERKGKPTLLGSILSILFLIGIIYMFIKHPRLMMLFLVMNMLGGGRRSGWSGGGGFGGGGFGGGGGGGFGGGGASGGW